MIGELAPGSRNIIRSRKLSSRAAKPNINQLQNSVRSLQTQMTELHKQVVFIIERQTKILLLLDKENVNKSEQIGGNLKVWKNN